jgi:DNA-binding NarL/FixJ family response regulator
MLTVSDDDHDLLEAVESGAQGYLLKSLSATEFLDMLNGLDHGEAALTRRSTARLMESFAGLSSSRPEPADTLTEREIQVLQLAADGLTNKALAQTLSISENTVKYHIKNILQKLGVQNRTEAATYAVRAGLFKTRSSQ